MVIVGCTAACDTFCYVFAGIVLKCTLRELSDMILSFLLTFPPGRPVVNYHPHTWFRVTSAVLSNKYVACVHALVQLSIVLNCNAIAEVSNPTKKVAKEI